MARNSSGTYSLPAGNPVVTQTPISSVWANNTLSDIATALTDSLSRSGDGGMLAELEIVDGDVSAPGLSFADEPSSGLYRAAAGDLRFAVLGTDAFGIGSDQLIAYGTSNAQFDFIEGDAAANNRRWRLRASGEGFDGLVVNDANSSTTVWLAVERTANTVDSVELTATDIVATGNLAVSGNLTVSGSVIGVGVARIKAKGSATSRTNDTVTADPDLTLTVVAGTYLVDLNLRVGFGAASGVPGLDYGLSIPGTPTGVVNPIYFNNSDSTVELGTQGADPEARLTHNDAGSDFVVQTSFYAVIGSGGTLALSWAQDTTNANATTLRAGSSMTVTRLA